MDLARVKSQVTQLLNAGVKSSSGAPTFSAAVGDNAFHPTEIENNILNGGLMILTAICETDGHPQRSLFMQNLSVGNESALPQSFGSIGTPLITPYQNAGYTIAGVEVLPEEVKAKRLNPRKLYADVNHDQKYSDNRNSELAGFYAVDGLKFYFTGYSAQIPVATFDRDDVANIPDAYEPTLVKLGVALSAKDGMLSDISGFYAQQALSDLALIRAGKDVVPRLIQYQNMRGTGAK